LRLTRRKLNISILLQYLFYVYILHFCLWLCLRLRKCFALYYNAVTIDRFSSSVKIYTFIWNTDIQWIKQIVYAVEDNNENVHLEKIIVNQAVSRGWQWFFGLNIFNIALNYLNYLYTVKPLPKVCKTITLESAYQRLTFSKVSNVQILCAHGSP
jgi:hypothetical protein